MGEQVLSLIIFLDDPRNRLEAVARLVDSRCLLGVTSSQREVNALCAPILLGGGYPTFAATLRPSSESTAADEPDSRFFVPTPDDSLVRDWKCGPAPAYERPPHFVQYNTRLDDIEIRMLANHDASKRGYNLTEGGGTIARISDETKELMRTSRLAAAAHQF